MNRNYKLERLQKGESFITSEKGNSMVPLIKSGEDLESITIQVILLQHLREYRLFFRFNSSS